jgi:soluble lytic murein transglycosylase-like protein
MAALRPSRRTWIAGAVFGLAVSLGPDCAAQAALDRWRSLVEEASRRFGVPQDWIRSVMAAESAGQTRSGGRPIVSPAGAMGLMQLMPGTWRVLRSRYGLGDDPFDPHDNILAGAAYLRDLYGAFGFPGLFAAYNAGPARFTAYRDSGRALPAETERYLAQVSAPASAAARVPSGVALFFALGRSQFRAPPSIPQPGLRLFFPLHGTDAVPVTGDAGAGADGR